MADGRYIKNCLAMTLQPIADFNEILRGEAVFIMRQHTDARY